MCGQGVMRFARHNSCDPKFEGGDVYVGEFRDDLANGYGVYTHSYGDIYTGE